MDSSWIGYAALFVAGIVAGTLNVIAGGGSFLTLPILIFLGLPPGIANATNRVAIFVQNVGAVWSFKRFGVLDTRSLLWAAIPATLGAIPGTWLALSISDKAFQRTLALLMVGVTLWTLWSPKIGSGEKSPPRSRYLALGAGFFLVGIYGGFIQAGVGFLLLAATTAAGLDLVRGNAVKVLAVLCFTSVSLGIFIWQGRVDWPLGLCLAGGNLLGGLLGARLTVLAGHRWIRYIVTATILVFAVKLWWSV
ncbi:MAG: sulfite exporter TauE/SafE family protein [bacterium]|nr:sulfite exporter TauE/SafE family protein [bacterium]